MRRAAPQSHLLHCLPSRNRVVHEHPPLKLFWRLMKAAILVGHIDGLTTYCHNWLKRTSLKPAMKQQKVRENFLAMPRNFTNGLLATVLAVYPLSAAAQSADTQKQACISGVGLINEAAKTDLRDGFSEDEYQTLLRSESTWNNSHCYKLTGKKFIEMLEGGVQRSFKLRRNQAANKENCSNFMIANGQKICI